MGSSQSSHADKHETNSAKRSMPEGMRGRKSTQKGASVPHLRASVVSLESHEMSVVDADATAENTLHEEDMHLQPTPEAEHVLDTETELESSDEEEDELESGDEIGDDEWEERLLILEEARQLKKVAEFFLHPEEPVKSSSSSRCYFERASAPVPVSKEEADEQAAILEDAAGLKKLAVEYLHPEKGVETLDSSVCARNYFTRVSAPGTDEPEEAEEHARILDDLQQLKQAAVHFLHPELPVQTTDATVFGRNYFSRPSAPEYESEVDMEERDQVFADLQGLKQSAVHFLHPELPVETTDPTVFGRNYFSRPSAPEYESEVDMEERDLVLADMQALKQSAARFLHPELPVETTDATACGRNYFGRASAPEYDDEEDAEVRKQIMEDLKQLKHAAMEYLHPELPVETTNATACGRNYFGRASAPAYESLEDAEVRAQVMDDMRAFKKLAVDFFHPELPVKTTDPTACGRNYFGRASAPEYDDEQDAEVRKQVLEDANVLKQLASDYLHPELPVVIYSTATGRNFFSRASASEYESLEDADVRAQVMEDMRAFKQLAVDFLHPELPAVVYATATGRNFFKRPLAAPQESPEEAEERSKIMADLKALKQSAVDFLHPELPVKTDAFACGRGFFSRFSAPTSEEEEEHEQIMAELKALKQSAVDFLHPELPVKTTDPFACGRNFFSRPSALTSEEEMERDEIMADLKALKQSAVDFLHPELPVKTLDPCACGRNYFSRASAPEAEDSDQVEERDRIMQEAEALKFWAVEYMHPEHPVKTLDANATGRCYYARPSSIVHDHMIHSFPRHEDEHTDHHSEHFDHFGMDEEMDFMFADMRHDLAPAISHGEHEKAAVGSEEEEGKLSRSPSSVMLAFDEPVY